jgi:hypothetical protein
MLCKRHQIVNFCLSRIFLSVDGVEHKIGLAWLRDIDCEISLAIEVNFEGQVFMAEFAD